MNIIDFYENLKDSKEFNDFLILFLEKIFPKDVDIYKYKQNALDYLFYDKEDFLHILKYESFGSIDSKFLERVFNDFQKHNEQWAEFVWKACKDKSKVNNVLVHLGNKKVEVLKTLTLSSFKSLENDVKNGEIVTNMLNSIVEHMQEMQKNQNIMFANISHEMRTPLNSVIGYLDVLESLNHLSVEDKKNIIYAKNSAKILLTLINDLLDTQKLSNATLDLVYNPFWINKVIKSAIQISMVNIRQKNINFRYIDKINVFDEVIGDKNRLLQILNNLFSNAVKFTKQNGHIDVIAKTEDLGDSVKLFVSIKDDGIGIKKEKQKDLFKPFSRVTQKEKGTGLGLYISKQLANRMDGDIWFESEEGKGSTFYLELKFKKSKNYYDKNLLRNRKIAILKTKRYEEYCKNLAEQLEKLDTKIKIFYNEDKFMQFLLFNKDIDVVIIAYPHSIEENDLDISFIKTYKKINENLAKHIYFIAGVDESYYPKNIDIFDKVVNIPITMLDLVETFSIDEQLANNYRYLIIDDEPMNRLVLATMLKTIDKQAEIDNASDGLEGLEKIRNNKYDLIFLDKRMPNLDGYEVLERLKNENIDISNIYLLTADGDKETMNKAKEYKIGYIAKPVTLSLLKSVIENVTGGKK